MKPVFCYFMIRMIGLFSGVVAMGGAGSVCCFGRGSAGIGRIGSGGFKVHWKGSREGSHVGDAGGWIDIAW